MITNLFSIFDPCSSFPLTSNWLSISFFLLFLPPTIFATHSRNSNILNTASNNLFTEISVISSPTNLCLSLFLTSLFLLLAFNNGLGLLSYNFTPSSHIAFSLSLALPAWFAYALYGVFNNTSNTLAHLVPMGTPIILIPFIVIIETISIVIRPFTLAIRLAANIIAGHLLITLLSSYASISSISTMYVFMSSIPLFILETAVALIQAYVFIVLSTLYINEI